jgi:endonuclease YncB( thermonuclease family)
LIGKPQPEQQQYAETVAASQAVQQEVFPTKSVNLITIPLPQASIEPAREMQNQAAFAAMLPAAESEPRKSANVKSNVNVKRFFVPAIFLIIAGALLAMLIGYARITQGGGQDEKEPTSLAEAALAPESQNSAVNNPVGENIIAGKVVDVAGGDTITVADASNVEYKIRLEGIDAPEPEQEFGTEAESNLFNLAFGKMVQVNLLKPGTDGFTVGRVMLDGNNVSLEQLKAGLARHDETIVFEESDNDLYAGGESAARSDGLGLWAAEDSLPPWEYSEKDSLQESEDQTAADKHGKTPKAAPNHDSKAETIVRETSGATERQTVFTETAPEPAQTKSATSVSVAPQTPKVPTPVLPIYEPKLVPERKPAPAGSALPAKAQKRGECFIIENGKKIYLEPEACAN